MENYLNTQRHYRILESNNFDEKKFQVIVEETDLLITLPSFVSIEQAIDISMKYTFKLRQEVKNYIQANPDFLHSLTPIKAKSGCASIINAMCEAAYYANVGPFAAIAGSVSQLTASMLVFWIIKHYGSFCDNLDFSVVVENGGDIYIYSHKERIVGILANPQENQNIGIKIPASNFPTAICSSSSKIGHSLSFGNGDIAMIQAKNAALADALATAYCNMLQTSKDIDKVIKLAQKHSRILASSNPFNYIELLDFLEISPTKHLTYKNIFDLSTKSGLEGVFLQCDEHIGIWGDLELVAIDL